MDDPDASKGKNDAGKLNASDSKGSHDLDDLDGPGAPDDSGELDDPDELNDADDSFDLDDLKDLEICNDLNEQMVQMI